MKFYKNDDELGESYCAKNNCNECMGKEAAIRQLIAYAREKARAGK
jgi:hypothetical protein